MPHETRNIVAPPIRVQVCDDSAPIRAELCRLIEQEPDLIITNQATNAEDALDQLRTERPDILLLDVTMPGRSGLEALPDLRAASPSTRIIMLSLHNDPVYARHALATGAHGYLDKSAAAKIIDTLRAAVT